MTELTYEEFFKKVMGTLLLPPSDQAEKTKDSTEQEEDE